MPANGSDVYIVVRTSGERTTDLCVELLAAQAGRERVQLIREAPLSATVRRTSEIGIDAGCKWTLAVDADVLLLPDGVRRFVDAAERLPESYFSCDCLLKDRLFGGPRDVGAHIYRTALLPRALEAGAVAKKSHRPETQIRRMMRALGHETETANAIVGLHDYEQWRRDYYRKGFVHAQKFRGHIPIFLPMWLRLAATDPDFAAVVAGAQDGLREAGYARTDIRQFAGLSLAERLPGVEELCELSSGMHCDVERIFSQAEAQAEFASYLAAHERSRRSREWRRNFAAALSGYFRLPAFGRSR